MLTVSLSPHIHAPGASVGRAMRHVLIALVPTVLTALWFFGVGALLVMALAIAGCMATEYVISRWVMRRQPRLTDGSALLTGLLLALNLPSNLPWWIVLIGSVVAIGLGKMCYGGLGCNIFNPALVGRVFLLLSFPAQMTTWPLPVVNRWTLDAVTGATTLSQLKADAISGATVHHNPALLDLLIGNTGGSMGEIGAIAILSGLAYLLWKRVITWHIPLTIIAAFALLSWGVTDNDVLVELLSGGLLLGAVFMATDYVTSPMTPRGQIIYGVMIALITVVIRRWGAYPEGMSFAILLMNGATPLINRWCKPRRYGEGRLAA